mmetsp:Transcript_37227/g.84643  ORF Transcript_37227/g.84643 Transcript_37227/m.84643 type:complete len:248 (-) Transcript_37227:206-949(-)
MGFCSPPRAGGKAASSSIDRYRPGMDVWQRDGAAVLAHSGHSLRPSRHRSVRRVAIDVPQALLQLLCEALEEGLHAGELLPFVVHLVGVVPVHMIHLGLEHPRGQAPEEQVRLDLLVDAALNVHGVALLPGLHVGEPSAGHQELLLKLPRLLVLEDQLRPVLEGHRNEAGLSGAADAVQHLLGVLLFLLREFGHPLLRGLDLILELPVLLVVFRVLEPRSPGQAHDRGVLVGAHPRHDLLRVVRLVL